MTQSPLQAAITAPSFTSIPLPVMDSFKKICLVNDIPVLGARVVKHAAHGDIAVFRNDQDEVFALHDKCPHKGGPLSQGIVFGKRVACPLHNWNIELDSGCAVAPDVGCAKRFAIKVEEGTVWLGGAL
jgi:nitrite reductase (NADH) small subunit